MLVNLQIFQIGFMEELPETVTICSQEKRVSDFEKSLIIPHCVGSIDAFFCAICHAIR